MKLLLCKLLHYRKISNESQVGLPLFLPEVFIPGGLGFSFQENKAAEAGFLGYKQPFIRMIS
jgi:hypothetical protein